MLLLIVEHKKKIFLPFGANFNDEKCFLMNNVPPLDSCCYLFLFMDHEKGPKYFDENTKFNVYSGRISTKKKETLSVDSVAIVFFNNLRFYFRNHFIIA
jgi:hypothetical protein